MVHLTISQNRLKQWPGVEEATAFCINQAKARPQSMQGLTIRYASGSMYGRIPIEVHTYIERR